MSTVELEPMPVEADVEPLHPYRLSIEQYDRIADAGILGPRDRVFLREGVLIKKMTKYPAQVYATAAIDRAVGSLLPAGWTNFQEGPVNLAGSSVPEPDLLVVRGRLEDFRRQRPGVAEVLLVVEVAESSLAFDQGPVLRAHADNLIPICGIVNIPDARIEVYREPTGPAERPHYRKVDHHAAGQEMPLILGGREVGRIAVDEILP